MSKQKTVAYVRSNSIYLDSRATKEIRSLLKIQVIIPMLKNILNLMK